MLKHVDANGNSHNVKEIRKKKGILPHSLVLYEYLQGDTNSWIDTELIPTTTLDFDMKVSWTTATKEDVFFGCSTAVGYASGNNYSMDKLSSNKFYVSFLNLSGLNTNVSFSVNTPYTFILQGTTLSINGTNVTISRNSTAPNLNLYLFARNINNLANPCSDNYTNNDVKRFYYCRFYDSGVLVKNFVPCTYRNIPGMWDTVEGKFYGNSGTGLFLLGPRMDLIEYDYLEGNASNWIDTGYKLNSANTTTFVMDCLWNETNGRGCLVSNFTGGNVVSFEVKTNGNFRLYNSGSPDAEITAGNNTRHYIIANTNATTLWGSINSTDFSYTVALKGNYTDTYKIFNDYRGTSTFTKVTRFYKVQILENNILIRDYVPITMNRIPGLWDKVEWKFYPNAGTGSFTVGNEVKSYDSIYEIRKPKVNNLLPDELELYEYLLSNGALYLDTLYSISPSNYSKIKLYVDFIATDVGPGNRWWVHGIGGSTTAGATLHVGIDNGASGTTNLPFVYGNGLSDVVTSVKGSLNTRYRYTLDLKNRTYVVEDISGTKLVNLSNIALGTPTNTQTIGLYAWKRGNTGAIGYSHSDIVYAYKLYDDNVLVRNLVPCKYNGQAGMWDTVTSTFYGNSGTGQFTLGPRLHLLECEYIESTGTQYIDTGIVVNNYFKIQAKFLFTATSNFLILYGMMRDGSNITPRMSFCGYSTTWMAGINNTVLFGTQDTQPHILLHIYNERNGEVIAVDGTGTIVLANPSSISSNALSLWLFARHLTAGSAYPSSARIYFYKLYDTDHVTLLRDYVPCICNGEAGLFDKVELKFYGNNGTGQFITGNLKTDIIYLHKDYSKLYLTFEAIEDCTFKIGKAISYSIDEGNNWSSLSANTYSPTVTAGNRIMWKGSLTSTSNQGVGTFISTGNFNVEGNIMSIVCGYNDNAFIGLEDIGENNYLFKSLFEGCTKLINAKNMALPATILSRECYAGMFYGCTNLVTAPQVLPGKTLGRGCYQQMFYGCTSLVSTPKLLATTLEELCCSLMFYNCTSLTEISELPATTLADSCYSSMFSGCTSLVIIPKLPATTLASSCYRYMFDTCTSLVIPPELPATTLANGCYNYMFTGCTSLTIMPRLPATTLANSCYSSMFRDCTELKVTLLLPVVTLALSCYNEMFYNCTSLTVAPQLPATILVDYCYYNMFQGCTSLTTAPELPAMTLAYDCYYGMFRGCTALTTAPELPAETLASGCYQYMFNNCNSLNYIKTLFTSSANETSSWVSNVASSGTFVKSIAAINWNVRGDNGIPTNWNIEIYEECMPLTFTAVTSGTFKFNKEIEYSLNGGNTWVSLSANTNSPTITAGNSIMWRGYTDSSVSPQFSSTGLFNVSNNVMSIVFKNNFYHQYDMTSLSGSFYNLFKNCTGLIDASKLCLPATTIKSYGYMFYGCTNLVYSPVVLPATTIAISDAYTYMFYNCTSLLTAPEICATEFTAGSSLCLYMFGNCSSLTTAPALPATTLANNCYQSMFRNCTSLVNPPELPATNMVYQCYAYMFRGCTSLETAPDLMAETIVNGCYNYMFADCTSLNSIKAYFTTTPSTSVTSNWVENVASTGTFHKNPNATWNVTGIHGIPTNWTVVSRPAYESMYFTIESVGTVDAKVKRSVSSPVLAYSLNNGTTWTNFTTSVVTLAPGSSMIIKGTVAPSNNGYGYILATAGNIKVYGNIMSLRYGDNFENLTSLTNNYMFYRLFYQCTRLTDVENLILPATTLSNYCYNGMFYLCTNITKAPVLPALGLVTLCYALMFYGCSKLSYIKAMFRTTPSTTYTNGWVANVASSGIFVKNSTATWTTTGTYGVPSGWTVLTASE